MTSPKFRSAASAIATAGGDPTCTKPAGTVQDDILIAVAAASPGQSLTPPGPGGAGWTALFLEPTTNQFGTWWKRAGGSEPANYTWATSGGSDPRSAALGIACYSGVPITALPTIGTVTKQTSTTIKGAAVVPGAGAALLIHVGGCSHSAAGQIRTAPVDGMTERIDQYADSGTSQAQINLADTFVMPYASTGDRNVTITTGGAKLNWGALIVLYQDTVAPAARDERAREVILDLFYYDEGIAGEYSKRYSGRGVTFSTGESYERRIMGPVEIRQHAADRAGVGGIVSTTVSDIRIDNRDGALNAIAARNLAVRRLVMIKTVLVVSETASDLGVTYASAVPVFYGITAALTPDGDDMILTVSDLGERLNVPLQPYEFDGTAGLGGGTELQGQSKPAAFGRCYNLLPQELGNFDLGFGSLYTYMVSAGAINNVTDVRERGVAIAETGGTPGVGQFRGIVANGVFQLGFTPNGIITCTVRGDDPALDIYANQHGEIVNRMLQYYGAILPASDVEAATFTDIDSILPGEIGIYFPAGDRSSVRDAIERVLRSGGIWMSGGRNGKLRLSMAMPMPGERVALKMQDIANVRPVPLPSSLQPAPHKVETTVEVNFYPLTDISSSVTGGTRSKLAGPGRTVESVSTSLQTRQKTQRSWMLPGLWLNNTEAQTRVDQIRAWLEQGLVAFEVTTDLYSGQIELGMGCEIESYPRFGLDGGFAGIVAGWRERPNERLVSMLVIGTNPAGLSAAVASVELREDGGAELREDDGLELRE